MTPKLFDLLLLLLRGMMMGIADLIPGLSGGTVALLTNLYPRLLHTLKNCNAYAFHCLLRGAWRELYVYLNFSFILPVLIGIGLGLSIGVYPMTYCWHHYILLTRGCLMGLAISSTFLLSKQLHQWEPRYSIHLTTGALLFFLLARLAPAALPHHPALLLLSGALASCAMLLPGISGSYILLLSGQYAFVLEALAMHHWGTLLWISTGAAIGLLACARGISKLLQAHHDATLATLGGAVLGSLCRLWPWQIEETVTHTMRWFFPATFQEHTLAPAQCVPVLCCMAAGFILPLALEYIIQQRSKK